MNDGYNDFDLRVECEERFDTTPVKKDFSKIGFGFLIFSGVTLLVSIIIQLVVVSVSKEIYYSHLFLNLLTPVSMYVFALPVMIAFWRGVKPCPPEKRKMRLGEWLLYLIVGLGLMYIGAMIGNNVMSVLSALTGNDYQNGLNAIVDGNMWVTAFFVVLVAPIGEEFVFRKLLIDRTGKYGCFISALMSGLVFGLMHGNLYQFFYAALLGFVLGYLYYNTGRIVYCIGIHAAINFIGSVVSSWLSDGIFEALGSAETNEQMLMFLAERWLQILLLMIFSLIAYAAMACAIILPIVFRKKLRFAKGEVDIPRGKHIPAIFLNVGIICMLIFYIVEIFISLMPAG